MREREEGEQRRKRGREEREEREEETRIFSSDTILVISLLRMLVIGLDQWVPSCLHVRLRMRSVGGGEKAQKVLRRN
jgi:hypothetical protein